MPVTPRQLPYHIADCGERCPVRQVSPWEFAWSCSCGEAGVISWAHVNEPPRFEQQPTLFEKGAGDEDL